MAARDSKGLWLKGHSGNPGGRKPRSAEVRKAESMAAMRMPEGVARMWEIVMAGKDSDSIKAMQLLCSIVGMGKPGDVGNDNEAELPPLQERIRRMENALLIMKQEQGDDD